MRVLSTIPYQRGLVRLLASMIVITSMLVIPSTPISHASPLGGPNFSIKPSFRKSDRQPRGYFIYNSIPGAYIVDALDITNYGYTQGSIDLYTADGITAQTSGTAFPPENAPRHDVGAWITLSRKQITLDPGQSQEVTFTLTIPTHVRPGQHGGGIIGQEMDPSYLNPSTQSNSATIGIQTTLALGVLVNLPGPTVERLSTQGISYDTQSYYQRLIIVLKNTGTQLLYPSGNLQVFDEKGNLVQNLQLQLRTFLPQTAINYPINILNKPLSPGRRYTAKLLLRYGHGYSLNYKTTFLVPLSSQPPLAKIVQNLVLTPSEKIFSQLY
jgi:Bacterial protein of unknown function (DUF916)